MFRQFLVALLMYMAATGHAATIAEGTVYDKYLTVKDRQGDSARIQLTVAYRLWPLMGEPVKLCVARWKLNQVTLRATRYSADSFPAEVWQEVTLYNAKAIINLGTLENSYTFSPSFICDLGVMGPPDNKTVSFNSPGSPAWDKFLVQGSFFHNQDNPYKLHGLDREEAKEYARKAIIHNEADKDGSISNRNIWGMGLRQASINLWPLRRHLRDEIRKARNRHNTDQDRGRNTDNRSGPGTGETSLETPPDVPDRQQLLRQAGLGNAGQSRQDLGTVVNELQRRKGSDSSLSLPAQNRKAPVSGVKVPHEPSSNKVGSALLLLIDTSGSMDGERIRDARKAAKDVIDNAVRQNTEVAILGFSGSCTNPVPRRHPFSQDAGSLHRFVDRLTADGGTPMSAAVEYANRYMAMNRSPTGKNEMIILLADGDDSCDILSPVVNTLKKDGVLFRHQTVGLEIGSGSSAARDLKKLAKDSNGDYQYAANSSQLNETFRRAVLAMEMLDMLGRFGEEEKSSPRNDTAPGSRSSQSILDGFNP